MIIQMKDNGVFYLICQKIKRRIRKIMLRPIRVFCLHQVSLTYDPLRCCECDWFSAEQFMHSIQRMQKRYTFISLTDARVKLAHSFFRTRRYAVLTFDDGYRSNLPVLNWLDLNHIPYTLFLNGKYLNGESCSAHILKNATRFIPNITEKELAKGLYLTCDDIIKLSDYEVGSHGYEHVDATSLNMSDLKEHVENNFTILKRNQMCTIPFHAYTWGSFTDRTNEFLCEIGVTPVLMDGEKNYCDATVIHRELFQ